MKTLDQLSEEYGLTLPPDDPEGDDLAFWAEAERLGLIVSEDEST